MISVDEVKQFIESIANKEQSGNTFTPKIFNLWLRRGTDDLFRKEYGLDEDYKPGVPLPSIGYEITRKIKDDLRVFKEEPILTVDSTGKMLLPADYVHVTAIDAFKVENQSSGDPKVTPREVEIIDDDKWTFRRTHPIKPPTIDKPIANFGNDHVKFEPKNIQKVQFIYLRYPKTPNWAFTVVDGVSTFDPANSVDVELPQDLTNDLSQFILSYLAERTRDQGLVQYIESIKAKGV